MVDYTFNLHEQLDKAIDNYLEMSALLRQDVLESLRLEQESQHWRRNYIRVVASLVDAHLNCIQEICVICDAYVPCMGERERSVLLSNKYKSSSDRLKYVLRAAYQIFDLRLNKIFGGIDWHLVQRFLKVRNALMHPKNPIDLKISDELWIELQEAAYWIARKIFDFTAALEERYVRI